MVESYSSFSLIIKFTLATCAVHDSISGIPPHVPSMIYQLDVSATVSEAKLKYEYKPDITGRISALG